MLPFQEAAAQIYNVSPLRLILFKNEWRYEENNYHNSLFIVSVIIRPRWKKKVSSEILLIIVQEDQRK